MKKKTWVKKIRKACEDAGMYRSYFDIPISQLADILERRDDALEQYEATGGKPVVVHTNKAGAKNLERNPALLIIDACEKTALMYWRDLGLTPAGLKRIDEDSMKAKKRSFGDILKDLSE